MTKEKLIIAYYISAVFFIGSVFLGLQYFSIGYGICLMVVACLMFYKLLLVKE